MTDIDRAIQRAVETYEATMCGSTGCCGDIKGALRQLAAEVLSLGESREDVVEKAKQVLAGDYNERHATSHKDAATAEEFTSEVAALASAGLLRSVDRAARGDCTNCQHGPYHHEMDVVQITTDALSPVEVLRAIAADEAAMYALRAYVGPRYTPFHVLIEEALASLDPVPEATRDEIAAWAAIDGEPNYDFADHLLSRYSIFPRHNPRREQMSETASDISEWEFGVAPESTKQYGDNSPWATFGGGETGRAMALTHSFRNPGNRVVRRHAHSSEWIEDAAGEES